VGLSTHDYLYKLLTLCELFISSQYGTGVLHNHMFDYVILQMKLLKKSFYPSNVFDLF